MGNGSLSTIVTVSVALPRLAFWGDEIVVVNVSFASSATSPITLIKMALSVSPGANSRVPDPLS